MNTELHISLNGDPLLAQDISQTHAIISQNQDPAAGHAEARLDNAVGITLIVGAVAVAGGCTWLSNKLNPKK